MIDVADNSGNLPSAGLNRAARRRILSWLQLALLMAAYFVLLLGEPSLVDNTRASRVTQAFLVAVVIGVGVAQALLSLMKRLQIAVSERMKRLVAVLSFGLYAPLVFELLGNVDYRCLDMVGSRVSCAGPPSNWGLWGFAAIILTWPVARVAPTVPTRLLVLAIAFFSIPFISHFLAIRIVHFL